jgi:hypothetical protein
LINGKCRKKNQKDYKNNKRGNVGFSICRFAPIKTYNMGPFLLFRLLFVIIIIGLLLGATLIIIRYWFSMSKHPSVIPPKGEEQKIILPLRLQAYERIILFLERIAPNNLIMRLNKPEMTSVQLQAALVKAIREEFEYNLSQQLYISSKAWEMVKNAKEETIKLINIASGKIPETTSSGELIRIILDLSLETESLPVNIAIDEIKKEVQKIF